MYRVYFVDREGHIHRPPEVIECADDQEAAERAKQFIDGQDIEVWQEKRVVAKLPAQVRPPGKSYFVDFTPD